MCLCRGESEGRREVGEERGEEGTRRYQGQICSGKRRERGGGGEGGGEERRRRREEGAKVKKREKKKRKKWKR